MNNVLLTVSGVVPADINEQIAAGKRPAADYVEMAESFGADLMDYAKAEALTGRFGRIAKKMGGPNLVLALACFMLRDRYETIFTDGEQIGIPLAFLFKVFGRRKPRPRHLMIVHILSVGKKTIFFDRFKLQNFVDYFFVYSTWQKQFIEHRWAVPGERVVWTPFMVDADFFAPEKAAGDIRDIVEMKYPDRPLISSVGLEYRDYPTLLEAVEGLPVQVVVAAGSPWSKRDDSSAGHDIPDNVVIHRFSQFDLRQLYADSAFVSMPLYHVNFQAGVTALLEAMAMEKAVVCTSTPGQTDVVTHDETGYYVPPEDPQTLRLAIETLLNNPELSAEMGQRGRERIVNEMSLKKYIEHLMQFVHPTDEPIRRAVPPSTEWDLRPVENTDHVIGKGQLWQKTTVTKTKVVATNGPSTTD